MVMTQERNAKSQFVKGGTPWNKGKKGLAIGTKLGAKFSSEHRQRLSESHKGQTAWNKGKSIKLNNALDRWRADGNKPHNWQSENPTYAAIHQWLTNTFGSPKLCEICGTNDPAKRYEWANITGKHQRKRDCYERMCKKCHNDFDGVNAWQQKAKI